MLFKKVLMKFRLYMKSCRVKNVFYSAYKSKNFFQIIKISHTEPGEQPALQTTDFEPFKQNLKMVENIILLIYSLMKSTFFFETECFVLPFSIYSPAPKKKKRKLASVSMISIFSNYCLVCTFFIKSNKILK